MREYLLAIERNHNDYVPIDWKLSLALYKKQNVRSLQEIDKLTSNISEEDLKSQLIMEKILSEELIEKPLVIIFEENGKTRKLASGIITIEEKDFLELTSVSDFLINNIRRRQLMNRIYNKFKDKNVSSVLKELLDNINNFHEASIIGFVNSLSKLSEIPYEELRELALFIKRDLIVLLKEEKREDIILAKENKKG